MNPSRALSRGVVLTVTGLSLSACIATTTPPSVHPGPPSASPSSAGVAPSAPASSLAAASVDPSTEPATETPQPTDPPTRTLPPIAGCGTGEAGFAAHRSEIPKTFAFGHATIEYTSAGIEMRDGSIVTGDSIPGGIGLTANEIGVVVAPGDHIILRASNAALLETSATAVEWSTVRFENGLADLSGERTTLAWRVRADGSLSISAPVRVGDWAVEFLPRWQSECLKGDGTAYARIKVR